MKKKGKIGYSSNLIFNKRDRGHIGSGALTFQGRIVYGPMKKQITTLLLDDQDGRCAICDDLLETPHLDHDHLTNEIRGVLCDYCNRGLGLFRDNPIFLAHAIKYLTGHEIEVPEPR